jgi:hypothetical protein
MTVIAALVVGIGMLSVASSLTHAVYAVHRHHHHHSISIRVHQSIDQ